MALTSERVRTMLADAGVDHSRLTITDDPDVWTDIETGRSSTSVRIRGPRHDRLAAAGVLFAHRLACAPYLDHDEWSE